MGRGDNRRSPKMKQRKAWRKLKARIQKKIAQGAKKKSPAPKAAAAAKK